MLSEVIALQFGGFYGGSIAQLLSSWEQAGFFSYVLPFLLIFAIVFGILSKMNLFGGEERKGLNAVIAIVVGLLALQFNFVPIFFSDVFPRLGIGLSVILVLFILVGMFLPRTDTSGVNYILLAVGLIVFIVVITKSFGYLGFGTSGIGNFIYFNLPIILTIIIIIIAVGAVIGVGSGKLPPYHDPYWRYAAPPPRRGP